VVKGQVKVLGSRFDMEEGAVSFLGDPSEPSLDLIAKQAIGSTEVELQIQGAATAPEITFASPDYTDQSQILTMIVTGKEPQQLSSEQAQTADQLLMSLLLSSVLSKAKLGSVSIDPDGTVRIGLPLGRVYAEGVYRVDPEVDENRYAVDFEAQLGKRVVLEGVAGDRQIWADLFWELRF
jgi:translocation and assembly module TamB